MRRLVYSLSLLAGLCACTPQQDTHAVYHSFQTTDTLVTEVHAIPPIMLYPKGMYLVDSFLVVYNRDMDTCYQVFDRQTLEYKYSFGQRGQGPEDFDMPQEHAVCNPSDRLVVNDVNKLKTITFQAGKPVVTAQDMPVDEPYFNGLFQLDDTTFVCEPDPESNEEFCFIHASGRVEKKVPYPETADRFKGQVSERNAAYQYMATAHPSGDKFAAFYVHTRRFQIIDKEGNILKDVTLDIPPCDPEIPLEPVRRRIHVMDVFATENYIYTLNLDMTGDEIAAGKSLPSLQIFSWEGEPLKQLYLDRFISSFTVDEQAQLVYGGFVEVEDAIYTFDLKNAR